MMAGLVCALHVCGRRLRGDRRQVGSTVCWLLAVFCLTPSLASATPDRECSAKYGSSNQSGEKLATPVTLESEGPADPINMGGLRGTGMTDITVNASPPLPQSVSPEEITIEAPKRIARNESGLSTAYLPDPTFSKPRIIEHGKVIAFTMCVDASEASAGSYVGQIIVGGPEGIKPATVAVTLKAKDSELFTFGIVLAGILALALLAIRSIKMDYEKLGEPKTLWPAVVATAKDILRFWVPTVFAIGAAVVAMIQVYDSNVAWGADTTASLIALGGTAVSAAGVGSFLSSLTGK